MFSLEGAVITVLAIINILALLVFLARARHQPGNRKDIWQ